MLVANQAVCPPNDISQNIVSDETLSLSNGGVVQGSLTVGSNSNSPTYGAGTLSGPIKVFFPNGGSGGLVQLTFGAGTNLDYSIWASTNLLNWIWAGAAAQTSPGQYQFLDQRMTNASDCFYRISAP